MRKWTDDHGDDGLRNKFVVYKPRDATTLAQADVIQHDKKLGADGEFIFVLRPETDRVAVLALTYYVEYIAASLPKLADEIMTELERIETNNGV